MTNIKNRFQLIGDSHESLFLFFYVDCGTKYVYNYVKEEMKKLIGVRVSEDLINKLRNIVYWTDAKSLNWLMEQSLQICVNGLEEANGGPFEQRKRELKPGIKKK